MSRFANKTVWITGASSGIGKALAEAFAAESATIILSGRRDAALQAIADALPTDSLVLPFDATDYAVLSAKTEDAWNWKGRVDILVNNAGVSQRSFAIDTDPQVYADMINIDLIAPIWLTQLQLPRMAQAGGAHIVAISSIAGRIGVPLRTAYCAAKHGVIGLTRTAAIDYGAAGITVNAVCPNHVTTGLGSAQNAYFSAFKGMTESAYLEEMAARIPLQRIGQAADTAAMCAFLASDQASFITGEAINVSGGEEMH